MINKPDTPFHPDDQVRNTRFLALYHWSKGLGMHSRRAFFIAKKKTLNEYPINPSEPLYRNTSIGNHTLASASPRIS